MSKAEEFLESKKFEDPDFDNLTFVVTLEHAKTYGKIVELEYQLEEAIEARGVYRSKDWYYEGIVKNVKELESELETLMKS